MEQSLDPIRIFVKVVQTGSFSKTAALLRLPKSSVSRTISRFEAECGTKLLARTTRSLTLTASGRAFYENVAGAVQALEDARRSLQGQDSIVAGLVRITAPEDLGAHVISPIIAQLSRRHPGLSFDMNYTDEIVDLVRDGYDLAIRIGRLPPSNFRARRLGEIVVVPVASPLYLKGRDKVRVPPDLAQHDCLFYSPDSANPKWVLHSKKGSAQVAIRPKIAVNAMSSLLGMAIQGAGISFVPKYLCQPELDSGKLVRVLPDWSEPGLPVSCVMPLGANTSSRLRLIADEISSGIIEALK